MLGLHDIAESLLDFLFPRRCAGCHRHVGKEDYPICQTCLDSFPITEQDRYRDNATEILFADMAKFERGAAWCFYQRGTPFHDAIHAAKFHHQPWVAQALGHMATLPYQQAGFFKGIDRIVPIPLHPKRLRERGYNQSELIALAISHITGIPIDTTHLVRQIYTQHQSRQQIQDREQLPENTFEVKNPDDWRGLHILLVDDIITTGATMHRAMLPMQHIRGCHYSVFCLGLSRKPKAALSEQVK